MPTTTPTRLPALPAALTATYAARRRGAYSIPFPIEQEAEALLTEAWTRAATEDALTGTVWVDTAARHAHLLATVMRALLSTPVTAEQARRALHLAETGRFDEFLGLAEDPAYRLTLQYTLTAMLAAAILALPR